MKKISFVLVIIVLMISCSQKKDNIQATLQGNYFCNAIYVKEHADPILGWMGWIFKDDPVITFTADSIYWNDTLIGYHNGIDHLYICSKEEDTCLSAIFYLTKDSLIVEDEDLRLSFYRQK